ncbi:hypothetical protein HA402_013471 [Bradysia odoriphaga]|nr:hypothetical protein HA402_013471 [Bradysia odoriphaga]
MMKFGSPFNIKTYVFYHQQEDDGTVSVLAQLTNNAFAYLFDNLRYELNGVEIDHSKNVGHTSTLKSIVSLNENESKMLLNAGWSKTGSVMHVNGHFNFYVPLKMLLKMCEN